MEFFEFNVVAWHTNDNQAYVMVQSSPVGGMRRPVLVPFNIEEMHAQSQRTISDFFNGEARIQQKASDLGRQLSQVILPPPVFTYLIRSLERIPNDDGLRLRLCLDEELVDLPWEWIYRPDAVEESSLAGFLILNPRMSLVRETPKMLPKIAPSSQKQRFIFAGAFWPEGDDRYQVKPEFERLSESLEPVKDLFQLDFIDSAGDNIEKAFAKKATIFHYTGHTDADNNRGYLLKIVSEAIDSSSKLYSDTLAAMLQKIGARIAVFNACNSGRWAFIHPLAEMGLPAIIGIYGTVSTEATIAFCDKLYSSLAVGLSLDEAVTWSRLHVLEMEQSKGRECFEWGSFMVYMPTKNTTIFPKSKNQTLNDRQNSARHERQNTIINVNQIVYGPQTNIGGNAGGPVLSGSFDGAVSIGSNHQE